MKYQEGLKETKDFLKTTPEPQMRELCNKAGLTELNTYSLASETQEKGTLQKILERIESLEITLKGKKDELLQSLFSQVNRIDSRRNSG